MRIENIEHGLYYSIESLFKNDLFLLEYDVHERTIAHRLAVYLEHQFLGFHVDCEYDNDLDSEGGRKRVYYEGNSQGKKAFPDIIVHHRGLNGSSHNLLVIEIKMTSSKNDKIDKDRRKLRAYTLKDEHNHLSFARGAFLVFGVRESLGEFSIEWYEKGSMVSTLNMKHKT